jgi:chromodomain-helicase-DNA-binding protein 4
MSGTVSDPFLLFTPPRPSASVPLGTSPLASASLGTSPTPQPQRKKQPARIFVDPPPLSSEDKKQYKGVPTVLNDSGVEFEENDIDEIVGEHDSDERFFFVRFHDGFAYRVGLLDIR